MNESTKNAYACLGCMVYIIFALIVGALSASIYHSLAR